MPAKCNKVQAYVMVMQVLSCVMLGKKYLYTIIVTEVKLQIGNCKDMYYQVRVVTKVKLQI